MHKYLHQHLFFKNKIFLLKIFVILIVIGIWIKQTYSPLTTPMVVSDADAYTRLWHIIFLQISNVWLPGFQYIMRIFSVIPDNGFFLNYRLGIYIFTILSSIVIFLIIQKNTNKFLPSLLGLSLFLFHPLTKQLSVITLTEIPWLFFLFLSIYFLFFTKHKNKIIFGLLAFIISETFRYESWFLLVILIPYLIYFFKVNKLIKIKSVLFIIIFPIFWMLVLNKLYDSPISFIFEKIKCSRGDNPLFFLGINETWNLLSLQINTYIFPTFIIFLLLLSGFIFKKLKILPISVISVYLFFCYFTQTLISFNENTAPRFFYFLVPALAIIIPVCLYNIYLIKNIIKIIVIIGVLMFTYNKFSKLNNDYYFDVNKTDLYDVKKVFSVLKYNNPQKIYICTQINDYYFSSFILYLLQYKYTPVDCNSNFYTQDNSSNIIITTQDENLYDLKIKYSYKIKFLNHIIYQ